MGTRYNIMVTATDAATARIKAIKKTLGGVVEPIANVGRSIKNLGKETGVDKLGKGLATVGREATGVMRAFGGFGGMAGLIGAGSAAALAAYAKQMIYSQSATLRLSATTGVAATNLQRMEGGARLAGLQAADLDGAVQSLGTTLQDARWGRNQGALLMMNRLGMQLKYTKKGAVDADASLGDLADILGPGGKLANAPVQTKALVAQQFGVEAMLPILLKGRKAWEGYQKAAAAVKPPVSEADLKRMDDYRKSIDQAGMSFEGLGQSILKAQSGKGFFDWVTKTNMQGQRNIGQYGLGGAIAHGALYRGKQIVGPIAGGGKRLLDLMGVTPKSWRDLGNLISAGEGGYNSINLGKRGGYKAAKVNLVESSVQSVMDAQDRGEFNAAGKYQITKQTLRQAVAGLHLDKTQKFDQAMQERIFKDFLVQMKRPEIADYVSGKSSDLKGAVKAASKEWASIADPDTGKSHYDGIANNKASIGADQFAAALKSAREAQTRDVDKGKRYVMGSNPAAEQAITTGRKATKVEGTITVQVKGLPAGATAEVTNSKGPVKTVLKTDQSMPDYAL